MLLTTMCSACLPTPTVYYPMDKETQESCMNIIQMYVFVGLDEQTRVEWIQDTLNYFMAYAEEMEDYQLDE